MNYASILMLWITCCVAHSAELNIVCTIPDLADITRNIGGDRVSVTALCRPGDNPHFITARPSYIRQVASADAFIINGMDLEIGWAPALLRSARNLDLTPGKPGFIDCSDAITPLGIHHGELDRSHGDVHPAGNPHYLLSPMCGIQVTTFISKRLQALDPAGAEIYQQRTNDYLAKLSAALYGADNVKQHGTDNLITWHQQGTLLEKASFTEASWMATMASVAGKSFIDDHDQWIYLARCFNFTIAAHLEPKAGVSPTNSHLSYVIQNVPDWQVQGIIIAPWFQPRFAQSVAKATNLPLIPLGHQSGSMPNTDTYLQLCSHNISALAQAMESATTAP